MEEKRLLFFSAFLLVTKEKSALYIHDCSSGVRDVTEDSYASFTCGEYSSYLEWSFSRHRQLRTIIGSCSSLSCSSQSASPFTLQRKTISQWGYESTLYVKNVTRKYNISLHCREGNAIATCRLRVIAPARVKNCDVSIWNWQVHGRCVVENMYSSDGSYWCTWRINNNVLTGYFQQSLTQYWIDQRTYLRGVCYFSHAMFTDQGNYTYSININSGLWNTVETVDIVHPGYPGYTCPDVVQEGSNVSCTCTSPNPGNPPAEFVWSGQNTDTFHVKNVQREYNGKQHTCYMAWGPNRFINRQTVLFLKVLVPVSIVSNSCSVELSGWKVYGGCTIQWLRTTKYPTCEWRTNDKKKTERLPEVQRVVTGKPVDDFEYVNCSFVHQVPADIGKYTYSISVSSHQADQFSKTLHFEKPDTPKHNCSNVTLEGSSINCTCFSTNLGNPPAQIGWSETNNEYFAIKSIKREKNGIVATCRLTWGTINYTTLYVVEIAYGPSETYINREESSEDKTTTVLICTAIDVYPSAMFRWNISCDKKTNSQNISRCTVSTSRIEDEMAVECTARNQIFVDVSSSSTYVFKLEQNPLQGGIIAGSAAAVLILAVIVAVIIVYTKRQKEVNKNMTQIHTVHFAAPSGDIYTIAGNALPVDDGQDEYVTVRDTRYFDNIPETQSPVARFAAPSGDLYTISGPATAVEKKQVTIQGANKNKACVTQSTPCHQAKNTAHQKNGEKESENLAKKPKPARLVNNKLETHTPAVHFTAPSGDLYTTVRPPTGGKNKQVTVQKATKTTKYAANDNQVHSYLNVTEVPTDSGLGVYHNVPWAATPQAAGSDAGVLDTSVISEEEYNVLRFQEDPTTQEHHAVTYSHLDFK